MNSRAARVDTGISVSLIASAVIHLAVFLLLVWWGQLFPPRITLQETYYVDVVSMPVEEPQAGSLTQPAEPAAVAAPAQPPMAVPVPAKTALKTVAKPVRPASPHESTATESAFAERMAKLERNNEASHEEAILEKLRNKVKAGAKAKPGMPAATGTEAGSRYTDYIRSRLEDALKITSTYSTRNPEIAVRLTISAEGKLSRMKIEHSSGDAAFELAVRRAIDLASEKFTEPPNRATFENGFIFRPKGITNSTSR